MAGMRHPNVLPLLASFVEGGSMWMVLPYYASGSLLSIVQYRHPDVPPPPPPPPTHTHTHTPTPTHGVFLCQFQFSPQQ